MTKPIYKTSSRVEQNIGRTLSIKYMTTITVKIYGNRWKFCVFSLTFLFIYIRNRYLLNIKSTAFYSPLLDTGLSSPISLQKKKYINYVLRGLNTCQSAGGILTLVTSHFKTLSYISIKNVFFNHKQHTQIWLHSQPSGLSGRQTLPTTACVVDSNLWWDNTLCEP